MSEPAISPDQVAYPDATVDQAVQTPPAADAGSVGEQFPPEVSGAEVEYDTLMAAWNAQEESGTHETPAPAPEPTAAAPEPVPQALAAPTDAGDPKNFRVSIKGRDEVTAKAIALIAHNPDMTIQEAVARITAQTTPTPSAEPAAPAPSAGQTLADIVARQDALKDELRTAYAEMDFEKVAEIQIEATDLGKKEFFATQRQAEADREAAAAKADAWDGFNAQASNLYPEATVVGSAFHSKMQSIFHAMEAAGDPLLDRPESTLRIAQMAALELGVPPVTAHLTQGPPKTPSAVPAPKPAGTPRFVPMDGGSSHGVAASATQAAAAVKAVERFTDEDWDRYNATLSDG